MENYGIIELNNEELLQINGGFGPLYYLFVAAYSAGVAYGYITEKV